MHLFLKLKHKLKYKNINSKTLLVKPNKKYIVNFFLICVKILKYQFFM